MNRTAVMCHIRAHRANTRSGVGRSLIDIYCVTYITVGRPSAVSCRSPPRSTLTFVYFSLRAGFLQCIVSGSWYPYKV